MAVEFVRSRLLGILHFTEIVSCSARGSCINLGLKNVVLYYTIRPVLFHAIAAMTPNIIFPLMFGFLLLRIRILYKVPE